ncbi:MAG: hypothetical protein ACFFG0_49345 [Candidatus Thorarchaeota archaeon]
MINKIKEVVKKTSVKTKVERIESQTFGLFFKLIIIDGSKSTFMLNKEEFDILLNQINKLNKNTKKGFSFPNAEICEYLEPIFDKFFKFFKIFDIIYQNWNFNLINFHVKCKKV